VIFLRPVVLKDPTLDGDFKDYRDYLPGQDFFSRPSPLEPARGGQRGAAPAATGTASR
jgi:general secretion pathway protein D